MRRSASLIIATTGGLALLANFHTSNPVGTVATGPLPTETTTAPAGSTRGTTVPSTTTTAAGGKRTIDGPIAPTDYGDVQVRVTLNGTQIVDVQPLMMPNDRSRSVRISQEAGPLLRQEVLRAQSANIDFVSGATYTSDGYIRSLQGALDKVNR